MVKSMEIADMGAFFSVVTVSKNNLAGLQKTSESLAAQNYRDFEWIVIDGGSNDGSAAFLKDTDAQWVSEVDDGIYDAMNKGIERATGEYLLFLNAGDQLVDEKVLQGIKTHIQAQNVAPDFVYGDALEEEKGVYYQKPARTAHHKSLSMFTHHQAMLYRRSMIGDLRYDLRYQIAADYDFTLQFLQKATLSRFFGNICIFEAGGLSQQKAAQGRQEQFEIRKRLKLCAPLTNYALRIKQAAIQTLRCCCPRLYWIMR